MHIDTCIHTHAYPNSWDKKVRLMRSAGWPEEEEEEEEKGEEEEEEEVILYGRRSFILYM